ncbi:hypothetical protein CP965_12640 [Halarcobacter mediterraneus]|uniref:Uncharacterized protein n=1 Tax=Halarcobacter mediterraneus TaxID=2023153 RepID=A0A4Q1AQ93_9BACT|nr:hypothetical protein [Halarcobacter mediterraneus]RXK11612.1 hypothetical protein CP965_12640 [Halarcobacter mediterraneus]
MKTVNKIDSISLVHPFEKSFIDIFHIEKPYGEYSDSIIKIELLEKQEVFSSIEFPYENLSTLIDSLQKIKDTQTTSLSDLHKELAAGVGGGQ